MHENQYLVGQLSFSGETVALWVAVAIAVLFLAVLVLDRATRRRQRRRRRYRREPETIGGKLRKPFGSARAIYDELRKMFRDRSRRRRGRGRRPPAALR
ncbi:MAG TPA: hypothetical protein P5205_07750 [Candidatus Paceibacterota bacterium]|nr:hypothetical protein [Candidatus Paceibacterota bacterium]